MAKEQKHEIGKDFKKLKIFKMPLNTFIAMVGNFLLSLIPKGMKSNKDLLIEKKFIQSFDNKKIKIYVIEPRVKQQEKFPCIIYFHGGAFVFKGAFVHYRLVKKYAKESGAKLVYVDYRLAPKHKYPVPLNDCFSGYKWVIENSEELKIDKTKIVVAGDSAGGCLASQVCAMATESEKIKPSAQMLVYPVLDEEMKSESMQKYKNTPMWNSKLNKKMWQMYLDGKEEFISPMKNCDDEKVLFPRTYIEPADVDCLHDEGVLFANKLKNRNVDVCINETKGTVHGFEIVSKSDVTKRAVKSRIDFLKGVFKN